MATAKEILNKVLLALRRDQVTSDSTTDDDELRVLQHVNSAKREIEDAHDWQALRWSIIATVPSGQQESLLTTALTDATGVSTIDVSSRSRLLYERSRAAHTAMPGGENSLRLSGAKPQVFQILSANTGEHRLAEMTLEQQRRIDLLDDDETSNVLNSFSLKRQGDYYKLLVRPTPASELSVVLRLVIPQADFTGADLTTVLSVPATDAVYLRALWYANQERGEELGAPGSTLDLQATRALADAISPELTDEDVTGYAV